MRHVLIAGFLFLALGAAGNVYAADPTCPQGQQWQPVKGACVNSIIPISVPGNGIPANEGNPNLGPNNTTGVTRNVPLTEAEKAAEEQRVAEASAATRAQQGQQPQTVAEKCAAIAKEDGDLFQIGEATCNAVGDLNEILDSIWSMEWMYWILALIAHVIFVIAQMFLWFGGVVLDNALYFLVVHMGDFVNSVGANGIRDAWAIIRNLCNLAIIAGFVYVGISTILQTAQYAADKFLTRLIIAALLVNFSYFFAGAIIDSSNYIASQIYTSKIMKDGCVDRANSKETVVLGSFAGSGSLKFRPGAGGDGSDYDLCSFYSSFMSKMRMESWDQVGEIAKQAAGKDVGKQDPNLNLFLTAMMASIFYFVTGFVFFAAGILLIGRFVALILLLISSPIGIAGGNIPFLESYANKWWAALWGQAFFAPVYILLVAISLNIIDKFVTFLGSPAVNYSDVVQGTFQQAVNSMPLFITYFVALAIMWAALDTARSMSKAGSEYFGNIYGAIDKRLGGLYGGAFNTITGASARGASAIYDRTIGQAGRLPFGLGAPFQAVGKGIRGVSGTKFFDSKQSYDEARKAYDEEAKALAAKSPLALAKALPVMAEAIFKGGIASILADNPKNWTAEQRLRVTNHAQSMTPEQIAALSKEQLAKLMPYFTSEQVKQILDRKDLTDGRKKELANARFADFNKAVNNKDTKEIARILNSMDETERKILFAQRSDLKADKDILKLLDNKKFEAMVNDPTQFTKEQADAARTKRGNALHADLNSGEDDKIAAALKRMGEKDYQHVDDKEGVHMIDTIVSTPGILRNMSPSQLRNAYEAADNSGKEKILKAVTKLEAEGESIHTVADLQTRGPRDIAN